MFFYLRTNFIPHLLYRWGEFKRRNNKMSDWELKRRPDKGGKKRKRNKDDDFDAEVLERKSKHHKSSHKDKRHEREREHNDTRGRDRAL